MFQQTLVLIKGAGDLASGVALRLHRAGFPVVMTEIAYPLTVRRTVAFAQAVFDGVQTVEDRTARRCLAAQVLHVLAAGEIAVLVDPQATARELLKPQILIDGIMAKHNTGTGLRDAPLVVALGPGFTAGADCHAVVETNRGHNLGRVIWQGSAEPDSGQPGGLAGAGSLADRVLRAPVAGHVVASVQIGAWVAGGAMLATIHTSRGERIPLSAPFPGVLRGIVHASVPVKAGMKIGDLDPRAEPAYCFCVSDKALAVAGGVLEASLMAGVRHIKEDRS